MICCSSGSERPKCFQVVRRIACALVLGVVLAVVLGLAVTLLWNHLMPRLFHLSTISYCQGLGLFVLGRLLFGGLCPGRRGSHHGHKRFHGHWHSCCRDKESEQPKEA